MQTKRATTAKPVGQTKAGKIKAKAGALAVLLSSTLLPLVPFVAYTERLRAQTAPPVVAGQTIYRLGPQDKVRIKVYAWRPARDEIFEWKALNDVYTISASGRLSLPLIGELPAGGRTVEDLAQFISEELRLQLGLSEAPPASVEVVQFRPFYILGAVQTPGEYAYRPGLILIQALSIAGGVTRLNEIDSIRFNRDTIATTGERTVVENEMGSLLARRVRLEAEANGADQFRVPAVLTMQNGNPSLAVSLHEEEAIFNARRDAFRQRLDKLQRLRSDLENDIVNLKSDVQTYAAHTQATMQEVKQFDDLLARKLTTTARRGDVVRNAMAVDAERRRLQLSLTQAQREIARIDLEGQELLDGRKVQATIELRATQARLEELNRRYQTAERVLQVALPSAYRLTALGDSPRKESPSFIIVRNVNGKVEEISATETTVVLPGDTVRVELPQRGQPEVVREQVAHERPAEATRTGLPMP